MVFSWTGHRAEHGPKIYDSSLPWIGIVPNESMIYNCDCHKLSRICLKKVKRSKLQQRISKGLKTSFHQQVC